jgi:hypothetical protein
MSGLLKWFSLAFDGPGDIPLNPELSKPYFLKPIIIRNLSLGVQTLQLGAEQLRYLDLS